MSIETSRLKLRWLDLDDAAFIYRLVNDPAWLRFNGDKAVANLDDARSYLESGPLAIYRRQGFGLNRVALKDSGTAIGLCGILQCDSLAEPDLGFALLPEYRGQGFAFEAAIAVLEHARAKLEISRIAAILTPDNMASSTLLDKLGFAFEKKYQEEPNSDILDLYVFEHRSF